MFSSATKSAAQGGGYNLTKSVRFRGNASPYLNRTPSVDGNRRTFTIAGWFKKGNIAATMGLYEAWLANRECSFNWGSNGQVVFQVYFGNFNWVWATSALYRDPSAWYHLMVAVDTTQASTANAVKIYVNGVLDTSVTFASYGATGYTQNTETYVNQLNILQKISTYDGIQYFYDGLMTDYYVIDGQALTPSAFGSFNSATGVFQPAKYTGTYGTNGFHLTFENITSVAALGYDTSGNSNNWTVNNISLTSGVNYDSMTDVPTLTSATTANYPVINPIQLGSYGGTMTPYAANLQTGTVQANADNNVLGSMAMPSTGKYYWEVTITGGAASPSGGNGYYLGVSDLIGQYSFGWQSKSGSPFSTTYTTNDVLGFACNKDAGTIQCFKNGTSVGTTTLDASYVLFIFYYWGNVGTGAAIAVNFGQQPFVYSPPSGFVRLNTYNLPSSTIVAGKKVMDATLYTGNGSTQSITNSGAFKPDLVWVKGRSSSTQDHTLVDSVRGTSKTIRSNSTTAELTETGFNVTAFNSNGFSVTDNSAGGYNVNGSVGGTYSGAAAYVGWQWQAGQGTTSSNTSGSITSTVSVNATAGFSIVAWNNPTSGNYTVGHGLGVAPKLIIVKYRSGSSNWFVYNEILGYTQNLFLNLNNAVNTVSYYTAAPTSSVINFSSSFADNPSQSLVAYCWSEIPGYSKFGSYTGNGDTTTFQPFIYTGFKPALIIIKNKTNAGNWMIFDNKRPGYNVIGGNLYPNLSNSEDTGGVIDFVANGFKLRRTSSNINDNQAGDVYVYAAFAENPFKNALAR